MDPEVSKVSEKAEVLLCPALGAAAKKGVTVFTKAKGGTRAVRGPFFFVFDKTVSRTRKSRGPHRTHMPQMSSNVCIYVLLLP